MTAEPAVTIGADTWDRAFTSGGISLVCENCSLSRSRRACTAHRGSQAVRAKAESALLGVSQLLLLAHAPPPTLVRPRGIARLERFYSICSVC